MSAIANLKAAQRRADDEKAAVSSGDPVVVTMGAIPGRAQILLDCSAGKAGDEVILEQGPDPRGIPLDAVVRGRKADGERKALPMTGPGDLVIFEGGARRGDALLAGKVATRIHDGHEGKVQVARCLARPSRLSVDPKKGLTQFMTIADPSAAALVRDKAGFEQAVAKAFDAPWPGGCPGFILRDGVSMVEVRATDDDGRIESKASFVRRMVETNDVLGKGPIEMIPTWSLPMGREQSLREGIDPRVKAKEQVGLFTRRYGMDRARGFLASLVILGDEVDRSFGADKGARRVVLGVHPLKQGPALLPASMPSAVRNASSLPITGFRVLHKDENEMEKAASSRARRRGDAPSVPQTPARPTVPPLPRRAPLRPPPAPEFRG